MPQQSFLHDWHNQTTLHPLGLVALIVLGVAVILLPRRLAVVPMVVMACFVSPAQRIVFLTLDFNLLRMMVLFGWARLLIRSELCGLRWKPIDTVIVLWVLSSTLTYNLLHGTVGAMINRFGFMFDAIGMYFMFRLLIRDWSDIASIARSVALISIPVALSFLIEKSTGRNMFAIFGGVPELTVSRGGKLRCQGAFPHPLLAGCFWASLMPLIASLFWRDARDRMMACLGLLASMTVILTCTSSTPLIVVVLGAVVAFLFLLRRWMQWIRWAVVGLVILLHFVMNNSVWHLLARIDVVGGSAGWYRYLLIDEAINHFGEWALIGTRSTRHWWTYGMGDVTNQYVLEGVNGGLVTLLLFLATIALAFAGVGRICRTIERPRVRVARSSKRRSLRQRFTLSQAFPRSAARSALEPSHVRRANLIMAWALGSSLFIHCIAFIAVSYFGQITMLWYLTLAMVGTLTPSSRAVWAFTVARPRGPTTGKSLDPAFPVCLIVPTRA
ncbi:MAG: hypothetical protein V3T84_04790 [Phycisphaerales bacterium]